VSTADRLAGLGATEPAPSVSELGGPEAFADDVRSLPAELLPRAVRVLDEEETSDPGLVEAFLERLAEIDGPLTFDEAGEVLVRHINALPESGLAVGLLDQLLAVFDRRDDSEDDALRAGYAIQNAVDLVRIGAGASEHGVLARLERVEDVPAPTATSLARAVGRMAETDNSEFLVPLLERVAEHEGASAQAMLELGLVALRSAFESEEPAAAAEELGVAITRFETASALEENRADARVFAAAARAVRALSEDDVAFQSELEALAEARRDYAVYDPGVERVERVVGPIHSVAAWDVLASRLRLLRSAGNYPDVTHLQPGLEIMAEAYVGAVLDTVEDARTGLRAFTRPFVEAAIEGDSVLARGAEVYEGPGELPTAGERGEERPKARPQMRPPLP